MKRHADLISAPAAGRDPRACWGLVLPGLFITGRRRIKGGGHFCGGILYISKGEAYRRKTRVEGENWRGRLG